MLTEILRKDPTYHSEQKLLKNKLTEDALKLEPKLIKYVLSDDRLKKHFFLDIDGVLVFDKDKFIQFVNDKQFLPDSYTSFKNTIGLLDENGDYFKEKKDVVLAWPYKDCVLEGGQDKEDQKRNEIFYNEILAPDEIDHLFEPKVLTNFKRCDKDGEHPNSKDLSRNDNLIIKGNNLLALHSLKKLYRGKVKLIYIDPPYKTDNDEFKYNDKFSESTWLTFMKNRLQIAKYLLCNNGVLLVQISDIMVSKLRILLDEVFRPENFINKITVKTRSPSGFKTVNLASKLGIERFS
jgi:adenine-specific DNA-methyltransferase